MRSAGGLAAALVLALPAAQAQNKCVDAQGRVTYQQEPCPGTAVRKPLPPMQPVSPPRPDADRGEVFVRAMCEAYRRGIAEARSKLAQEQNAKFRADMERSIAESERDLLELCGALR